MHKPVSLGTKATLHHRHLMASALPQAPAARFLNASRCQKPVSTPNKGVKGPIPLGPCLSPSEQANTPSQPKLHPPPGDHQGPTSLFQR